VIFYHYTGIEEAQTILREGFKDGHGRYGFAIEKELTGVWVSDTPLDSNDASLVYEQVVWLRLTVTLPQSVIDEWEIVYPDGGSGYREWLFPAELLNAHSTVELYDPFAEENE
jgi:hypothetical protein